MNANYKMTYKMPTATKYLTPRPNSNRQARMECPLSATSGRRSKLHVGFSTDRGDYTFESR